jgi:hypothetical protein
MPVELHWEAPGGVYRRYVGRVTIAERDASFDAICADPRFDRLAWTITDYLAVTDYEISRLSTEEVAARHIAPLTTNPNIVIAGVVLDPAIIAEIRHFIALGFFPQEYRLFPTVDDARVWIRSRRGQPLRPRPKRF